MIRRALARCFTRRAEPLEFAMHGPIAKRTEADGYERAWRTLLDPATSPTHYWVAAGTVALSLLLAFALHPWLGDRGVFLLFVPAVLLAAGLGGLGPGLLATRFSAWRSPALIEAGLFAVVGIFDTVPDATVVIDEHGIMQSFRRRRRAPVRLSRGRGRRPQCEHADAVSTRFGREN